MHAVHGSHHRSLKKAFMFKDSMFEGEIHEFWGEALKTAVHVYNRSHHMSLKKMALLKRFGLANQLHMTTYSSLAVMRLSIYGLS